ncbi:hypothetical protein HYSC106933_07530 [Hydrogenibacillus schlegelii]
MPAEGVGQRRRQNGQAEQHRRRAEGFPHEPRRPSGPGQPLGTARRRPRPRPLWLRPGGRPRRPDRLLCRSVSRLRPFPIRRDRRGGLDACPTGLGRQPSPPCPPQSPKERRKQNAGHKAGEKSRHPPAIRPAASAFAVEPEQKKRLRFRKEAVLPPRLDLPHDDRTPSVHPGSPVPAQAPHRPRVQAGRPLKPGAPVDRPTAPGLTSAFPGPLSRENPGAACSGSGAGASGAPSPRSGGSAPASRRRPCRPPPASASDRRRGRSEAGGRFLPDR